MQWINKFTIILLTI